MHRPRSRLAAFAIAAPLLIIVLAGCGSNPSGSIVFGAARSLDSNNLTIKTKTSSFASGTKFAFVAYLSSKVGVSKVTVSVASKGQSNPPKTANHIVKVPNINDDILGGTFDTAGLSAGRYTMSIKTNKSTLARGDFTLKSG